MEQNEKLKKPGMVLKQFTEGLRAGLLAFIINYIVSVVIALIIGLLFLENVNDIILGDIGSVDKLNFLTLLRMTVLIMNFTVFNSAGAVRIGFFLFSIIPFISFFIADRRDNRKRGLTYENIIIYMTASIVFTLLLGIISNILKGELIGIHLDFVTLDNLLGTLSVTIFIQIIVGIIYKKDARPAIKTARFVARVLLGASFIIGTIGLLRFMQGYSLNPFIKLGAYLALIPNITLYNFLSFMGVGITMSDSLLQAGSLEIFQVNLGLIFQLQILTKVMMAAAFEGLIIYCLMNLKKERFLLETLFFSIILSVFSLFMAYTTLINLGTVIVVGDIYLGTNVILSYIVPFSIINITGLLIYLIRSLKETFKEE